MATVWGELSKDPFLLGYLIYALAAAGLYRYCQHSNVGFLSLDVFFVVHIFVSWIVLSQLSIFGEGNSKLTWNALFFFGAGLLIMGGDFIIFFVQLFKLLADAVYTAGYRLGRSVSSLF